MKRWRGRIKQYPVDPDIALARQMEWTIGPKRTVATASYPEPCNLTAASAWAGRIPDDMIATESIIYRDHRTGYWVQTVAIKLIPVDCAAAWQDLQLTGGALAVWSNTNAMPPRRQIGFIEQELNPRNKDCVTYTHVLEQMGKLKIGTVDLKKLYPDLYVGVDHFDLSAIQNINIYDGKRLKGQRANGKCVYTPHGIYLSAVIAAKENNIPYSRLAMWCQRELNGYRYITREEYLRLTNINNSEEQSSN